MQNMGNVGEHTPVMLLMNGIKTQKTIKNTPKINYFAEVLWE